MTEKITVTIPTTLSPVTVAVTDASGNSVTGNWINIGKCFGDSDEIL